METSKYSLQNLLQAAGRLKDTLAANLNPVNNLEKLLESHKFVNHGEDVTNFLYNLSMHTEEFFKPENMPASWSVRAYSNSMESLLHVLADEEVKANVIKDIGEEEYEELVSIINSRRKQYMNEAKKETRRKNKEEIAGTDPSPLQVVTQLPVSPPNLIATEPLPTHGGTKVEATHENEETKEEQDPSRVNKKMKHLNWILDRYTEIEQDPFKRLILDLMRQELDSISSLI